MMKSDHFIDINHVCCQVSFSFFFSLQSLNLIKGKDKGAQINGSLPHNQRLRGVIVVALSTR